MVKVYLTPNKTVYSLCQEHKKLLVTNKLTTCLHKSFKESNDRNVCKETFWMKKKLMDILACPIDKHHPLELHIFEEKEEIIEGLIICPKCLRWYPIRDEIPEMLPDELRDEKDELPFLKKWKSKIPKKILSEGKPFNLEAKAKKKS
jgi:uncharacterized protein YbaR (Trm112 family)